MSTTKALTLDHLKEEFNQLKTLLTEPELYLWNYFSDLKNEIDLSFSNNLLEEPTKHELINTHWIEIIDRVKLFEQECITTNQQSATQSVQIFIDANQALEEIETTLNQLIEETDLITEPKTKKLKRSNPHREDEEKLKKLKAVYQTIYEQTFQIERILFLNTTIIFLDKIKWTANEEAKQKTRWYPSPPVSIFASMDQETAVGKLIYVTNQYFSKKCVKMIQNELSYNPANFHMKLSNEILKCDELKKELQRQLSDKYIDEIQIEFRNITTLEAFSNNLTEINADLFEGISELRTICIKNSSVETIAPNSFSDLHSLRSLTIVNNRVKELDENLLKGLTGLVKIDLSENRIKKIPAQFFDNLPLLHFLILSKNELTVIESNLFSGVTGVYDIYITNNQITHIHPEGLHGLKNLARINLTRNLIRTVDIDLFRGLTNLTLINLSSNKLMSIPDTLFRELKKLKYVDLSKNEITHLDANLFTGLTELSSLILKQNKLSRIDQNMFKGLVKLVRINLSRNELSRFEPDTFKELIRLATVDLGYNKLSELHQGSFTGIRTMKRLVLTGNKLKQTLRERYYMDFLGLNAFAEIRL